jgi:hypothetical protein
MVRLICSCNSIGIVEAVGESALSTTKGLITFPIHEIEGFDVTYSDYSGVLTIRCRSCNNKINIQL